MRERRPDKLHGNNVQRSIYISWSPSLRTSRFTWQSFSNESFRNAHSKLQTDDHICPPCAREDNIKSVRLRSVEAISHVANQSSKWPLERLWSAIPFNLLALRVSVRRHWKLKARPHYLRMKFLKSDLCFNVRKAFLVLRSIGEKEKRLYLKKW